MEHIFEEINHIFGDVEVASILVIILILSLIIVNITAFICLISMRKSLKRIANHYPPEEEKFKKDASPGEEKFEKSKALSRGSAKKSA